MNLGTEVLQPIGKAAHIGKLRMLGWAGPIAVPGLGDSPLILTHQVR